MRSNAKGIVSESDLAKLPTLPPPEGFLRSATSWMALDEDRFGWQESNVSELHNEEDAPLCGTQEIRSERQGRKEDRCGSEAYASNPKDVLALEGWTWKGWRRDGQSLAWRIVFDKHLTKYDTQKKGSDPNAWKGRIIVPRSSVEDLANVEPGTSGREISLSDLQGTSSATWKFVLKGWNNRRKKMYVLEGAGGYLSAHGLQPGDRIAVLVDPSGCLHLQHEKKRIHPSR